MDGGDAAAVLIVALGGSALTAFALIALMRWLGTREDASDSPDDES